MGWGWSVGWTLGVVALLLIALLLAGCSPAEKPVGNTRSITWVQTDNPAATCERLMPGKHLWLPDACADFRDPANCVIYARDPVPAFAAGNRQPMYQFGHEVLHCFVGDFHG